MLLKKAKAFTVQLIRFIWIGIGAFLAAFSLEVFLIPNRLIDGGMIGVSMIFSYVFGGETLPLFLVLFTTPFLFLAYRYIGKIFLLNMFVAILLFVVSIIIIQEYIPIRFKGESLEVVVIGGAILGIGTGLIIRFGGCLDGTEILGIILNRNLGVTVGQVVMFCNVFVFGAAGFVFRDWHPPLLSLITFMVATKVMDAVIVGLEETKSIWIISSKSKEVSQAIVHELGLGLTIMYGRGGYSGEDREILYVISERLQLSELKDLIYRIDPLAFVAIENLHEVYNGAAGELRKGKNKMVESFVSKMFKAT